MFSDADDFTHQPPARRTLATVVADLAQLKAHIDQTDHDLADYWHHHLTLCGFTAQLEADRQQFHSVIDSLRSQTARMWEQARWVPEGLEPSPQELPPAQTRRARLEMLRRIRHSSEAATTSPSFDRLPGQKRPELN